MVFVPSANLAISRMLPEIKTARHVQRAPTSPQVERECVFSAQTIPTTICLATSGANVMRVDLALLSVRLPKGQAFDRSASASQDIPVGTGRCALHAPRGSSSLFWETRNVCHAATKERIFGRMRLLQVVDATQDTLVHLETVQHAPADSPKVASEKSTAPDAKLGPMLKRIPLLPLVLLAWKGRTHQLCQSTPPVVSAK